MVHKCDKFNRLSEQDKKKALKEMKSTVNLYCTSTTTIDCLKGNCKINKPCSELGDLTFRDDKAIKQLLDAYGILKGAKK